MALHERAMLVNLRMTGFTGERTSQRDTEDLLDQKQAKRGSATVTVKLVDGVHLRKINSVTTKIREEHRVMTLPWSVADDVLPTSMFFEHSEFCNEGFRERQREIDAFCDIYPSLAGSARERLGDLDFERLWLPVEEVRSRFTHRVRHFPLPASSDFRAAIDDNDRERLRQEMERDITLQVHEAISGVRTRIVAEVTDFISRLKDYRIEIVDGKPKVRDAFRNSIMNGVRRLAEVLPKLNLTNDPELDRIHEGLVLLAKQEPDTLREDETARLVALKVANDIVNIAA